MISQAAHETVEAILESMRRIFEEAQGGRPVQQATVWIRHAEAQELDEREPGEHRQMFAGGVPVQCFDCYRRKRDLTDDWPIA